MHLNWGASTMDWYYSTGESPVGPRTQDDIEGLLQRGEISADTLVWRKGLADWVPLADAPDLSHLLDDALPPPVPPARPQATASDEQDEQLDDEPDLDDPADDDHEPRAMATPRLAGPWERYFARSIDLTIILSLLVTGLYLVLPSISLQLALDLYNAQPGAVALLLLPLALFINAGIIALTGNSLGKAIFAIRAEPIDGRQRFGFGGTLKREFTVWLRGLALGIPLLNLFTMVPAYRAVGSGKPAPYDVGRAAVRSYSNSQLRSALGIIFGILLYLGIFALNGVERAEQSALAQPSSWTNPITGASVAIPPGWTYEEIATANGPVHGFTNMKTGLSAILSYDPLAAGTGMADYTTAVSQNLAASSPSAPGRRQARLKSGQRAAERSKAATRAPSMPPGTAPRPGASSISTSSRQRRARSSSRT